MPSNSTNPAPRGRRGLIIVLAALIFLLLLVLISQQAFNLTFLRPGSAEQTVILTSLSALVFLLFVALTFVLLRNLLKLLSERRGGVLGSRFRTKMVFGALLMSFTPALFMFLFTYLLTNRSIDRWFSRPVQDLSEGSQRVASLLVEYAQTNAQAEAQSLAANARLQRAFDLRDSDALKTILQEHAPALQGGFAVVLRSHVPLASIAVPSDWSQLGDPLFRSIGERRLRWGNAEYMVGENGIGKSGMIIVAVPLPESFGSTMTDIAKSQHDYQQLAVSGKALRRTYILLLLLITALVLFAATWLSLFISKLVTRPVAALAEATEELSQGHFSYRVAVAAADELGELVASFNRMAAELEESRAKIEQSSRELAQANSDIEQRRRQTETILENIPTGVLSLDAPGKVRHANPAFVRLLKFGEDSASNSSPATFEGASLRDIFGGEIAAQMFHLLRKADRMGTTTSQFELQSGSGKLSVAITVASLRIERQRLGYVMVFEDFTELLRAQKQAAWREVARRVAHEIKNPLTPIALSAERIRRHLERGAPPDQNSMAVMQGCAETIGGAVETVRQLVDEFSTLARFPTAQPRPSEINGIIESALQQFSGRLDGVRIRTDLAPDLPPVLADPDAMRRAIANLVDNAAEALHDSMLKEIFISTSLVETRDTVEIVVSDTGHGVTGEMKERLFLPYFSTKKRGTGLGLPIVSRIMQEHNGSIRVEENQPVGARFVLELPVAAEVIVA
ncbi:MAG: HAMP domain-containing protein [Acidobacteria bacterium]|nr:HAMP domain-containing protein [Acidobacteriota bacterium]